MKRLIVIYLLLLSWSVQAKQPNCLEEKGHYILALIAVKMDAYIIAKETARINGKYDSLANKQTVKCEKESEDIRECDDLFENLMKKKSKERSYLRAKTYDDSSWCSEKEDIIQSIEYMRKSKVKYCKHRDAGTETTIGESYNSLENEWKDGDFDSQNSCKSRKKILNSFRGTSAKVFELPAKELCTRVLQELKSQYSECVEEP